MSRDIKFLEKDLQNLFESVLDNNTLMEIGERMREIIYKRTKSGKGLSADNRSLGGTSNKSLDKLSPSYVEQRRQTVLGPFGSPNRSNLTLTGEMLESMKLRVRNKDVEVYFDGQHGSGISMRKLVDEVSKKRPFFGLSETELKLLDSFIRRKLRERLRELNK